MVGVEPDLRQRPAPERAHRSGLLLRSHRGSRRPNRRSALQKEGGRVASGLVQSLPSIRVWQTRARIGGCRVQVRNYAPGGVGSWKVETVECQPVSSPTPTSERHWPVGAQTPVA